MSLSVISAVSSGAPPSNSRAIRALVSCTEAKQNLMTLAELIEGGEIHPVIDRTYPFAEIPAAVSYQEEGHTSGKVVISL